MAKHSNDWYLDGLRQQIPNVINGIFEEFLPPVESYVKNNNGTREDARDVFMYGIETMYRKIDAGELELTAGFSTYLFEVCKRYWLKNLRRNKYDAGVTPDDPSVSNRIHSDSIDVFGMKTERHRLLSEKFSVMQDDCRMVLSLSWQTDLSTEDIAEAMNWTYAYARKRKHVCKEYLIQAIKADPRYAELRA